MNIKINNKEISCESGKTIMQVAKDNGIIIPGLCYHPDFPVKANCRVCMVEIKGERTLKTSCSTEVRDGMEIFTDTPRVKRSRNLNIELIFAEHIEKCPTCIWRVNCPLLDLAEKYKIEITRFKDRKGRRKIYKFANAVEIDGTQCIDCRNCLDACNSMQKINYLKLKGKGIDQEVVPVTETGGLLTKFNKKAVKADCIYCGQCAVHCPVGAAQEQSQWEMVERTVKNKNKIIIAQFAPSIRVSIGEEFGVEPGKIVTGQLVSGLKQLGFKYIFDVNFGADITTMVEAEELIKRLTSPHPLLIRRGGGGVRDGVLPMFTSCCPAWIKYVEYFHPELIKNITSARSPQIHAAGLIKTYWAEKIKLNPKNIVVVSIMPCTAKKFEASRPELKVNGLWPIDYVITTRELAWLFKKHKVNFLKLKPSSADDPFGQPSGAAAIYGATGGVMESALRTAEYLMQTAQDSACDNSRNPKKLKFCNSRVEFKDVRGLEGVKEAELDWGKKKVKVAVVNGIGNIEYVLDNLDRYAYIEVMACPGGCIGGGGQPIPTTPEIRAKRLAALYKVDQANKIRKAHENEAAIDALIWLKNKGKLEREVLQTKYKKRN